MDKYERKIQVFTKDYFYKKKQVLKYLRIAEITEDSQGKNTLMDKAEKWMRKAEAVLEKITQIKQMRDTVQNKIDELTTQ